MKTILLSTAALLGVLSATAAVAQPAAAPDVAGAESSNAVRGVVVTANRAPTASAEVAQAVTVLDRAQIEASQAILLPDLLGRTAGVTLSRNGGPGGGTALRPDPLCHRRREAERPVGDRQRLQPRQPAHRRHRPHRDPARRPVHPVGQPGHRGRGQCRHHRADQALPGQPRRRRRRSLHRLCPRRYRRRRRAPRLAPGRGLLHHRRRLRCSCRHGGRRLPAHQPQRPPGGAGDRQPVARPAGDLFLRQGSGGRLSRPGFQLRRHCRIRGD